MKRLISILAILLVCSAAPAQKAPDYSSYILTPKAPDTPRINGPKVYGARAKADFLFRIPASGAKPMRFSAKGLPRGLKLDSEKGIISGKAQRNGSYKVQITATNTIGSDSRELRIEIGDKIALTPPLGWNSWNCWGDRVTAENILQAARALDEKGLSDYGWSYVNIDDGWQGKRGGKYNAIQPNAKFPDMNALGDSLHARGFKFGIYSGPWIATYAAHIGSSCDNPEGKYWWVEEGSVDENYKLDLSKYDKGELCSFGKYSFAKADARQWADWGVDYLKYDWFLNDVWWLRDMREALDATGRDIVYSISNATRICLAPDMQRYAHCWRTAGDIQDTWTSVSNIAFDRESAWVGFAGPGNWPDADMMVLGQVGGWEGGNPHWTRLTPWEQYSHVTLWAILASPMLLGCDPDELDDFTLSLLTNNEVLEVNQDPLGMMGVRNVFGPGKNQSVYVKRLEDGSLAVAVFNLRNEEGTVSFVPRDLGLLGVQTIRDLWRQCEVGQVQDKERWEVRLPAHGCALYRLSPGVTEHKMEGKWWEIRNLTSGVDAKQPSRKNLRVMSYNIRYSRAQDGENSWEKRREATPAMILDLHPDVIGLQEALQDQVDYVLETCPDYKAVGVGRNDGKQDGEQMSVFYDSRHLNLIEWGTYWLSETPDIPSYGWDAACRRTATWTLFEQKSTGRRFYFVNTHLDHVGATARKEGLALVYRKIQEMNPSGYPMVLVGDFNVYPDDECLTDISKLMLSARFHSAKADNIGSFNGFGEFGLDSLEKIDYIYFSGFSSSRCFKVVTKSYAGKPYISDHYPVFSDLRFR